MFWTLSKTFWLFAQPLALIGLTIAAGLLLSLSRFRLLSRSLVLLGLLMLALAGFTNLGKLALQPLEARYAQPADLPDDVAGLIVLGGGTENVISQSRDRFELDAAGDRYVEAVRLALADPALSVLVSGGIGRIDREGETDAVSSRRLFRAFGIDDARIRDESASRDTYENAVNSAALLDPQPGQLYVLITSAYHMPRSVAVFKAAGFDVLPWPVDFRTSGNEGFALDPIDAGANLELTTTALHEWIGLYAYWIRGRIPELFP